MAHADEAWLGVSSSTSARATLASASAPSTMQRIAIALTAGCARSVQWAGEHRLSLAELMDSFDAPQRTAAWGGALPEGSKYNRLAG